MTDRRASRPPTRGEEPVESEHSYVFLDGRVYVAPGKRPPGPVFTADLYRNLEDLRSGRVAEPGVTLEVDCA
jgi:hypothetical protein